jgi:hypothetical protein
MTETTPPFFTIIAAYYQGVSPPEVYARFCSSLLRQSFTNAEVLVLHDGPLLHKVDSPFDILCTQMRHNLWGHNLRKIGLQRAKGRYILHTNIDNEYHPDALASIHSRLVQTPVDILIARIEMMGLNCANGKIWYDNPRDYSKSYILPGNPPVFGNIDLMQAVIAKKIWDRYGWFNMIEQADGIIYSKMCAENPYLCTDILIGRHY